jgi:hypothetical protein
LRLGIGSVRVEVKDIGSVGVEPEVRDKVKGRAEDPSRPYGNLGDLLAHGVEAGDATPDP